MGESIKICIWVSWRAPVSYLPPGSEMVDHTTTYFRVQIVSSDAYISSGSDGDRACHNATAQEENKAVIMFSTTKSRFLSSVANFTPA